MTGVDVELVSGGLVNILGALFVAALGVAVLWVSPRRGVNQAFAVYAVGFGLSIAATNSWFVGRPGWNAAQSIVSSILAVAGVIGLLWLAAAVGRRPQEKNWPSYAGFAIGFASVVPVVSVILAQYASLDDAFYISTNAPPPSVGFVRWYTLGFFVLMAGFWSAVATMTIRAATFGHERAADAHGLGLLTSALCLFPGFMAGSIGLVSDPRLWPYAAGSFAVILACACVWMVLTKTSAVPRTARNAALILLAAPLVGMVFSLAGLGSQGGTVRVISVLILSYAIVRHQLLGIEVKARWTLSKTTVAAAFIAVFFVATELANEFFGEQLGSSYWGILAAGALVFLIAPLQRASDRLAARVVPVPAAAGDSGRETTYREAVRMALRGGISKADERTLAVLARDLGIDAARAFDLRQEAEAALLA